MTILYLDYNCFQRGFDDPGQIRIQLEALACQELFDRATRGDITLVWSFMHEDETWACPFPLRQQEAFGLSSLCRVRIGPEEEIRTLALSYQQSGNLAAKDALHLACATYSKADCFVTCDNSLIKRAKRLKLPMRIVNPVDYVGREVK